MAIMITLTAKHRRKQKEMTAVLLFVVVFGLDQCAAPANVTASTGMITPARDPALREPEAGATAEAVDANGVLMVHNVWVDTPLTQVFRDISMETGVVIVTCPHIPDPLISLDAGLGKPVDECMQELLSGRGLFARKTSQEFYIVSCGSSTCPSSIEIADYKRLCLKYISAKHLRSSLPKSVEQYVSTGERENEVLIYAAPEIAKHIMDIITELDVPRQQVMLEVLVVELWEEAGKQFGLDWEYAE